MVNNIKLHMVSTVIVLISLYDSYYIANLVDRY